VRRLVNEDLQKR